MAPFKLRKSKKKGSDIRRDGSVSRSDPKSPGTYSSTESSDEVSERNTANSSVNGSPVQHKQSAEIRPTQEFINRGPGPGPISNGNQYSMGAPQSTGGSFQSTAGTPNQIGQRSLPMIPTAGQSLSPLEGGRSPVPRGVPQSLSKPLAQAANGQYKPVNPFAPVPVPQNTLQEAIEKFTPWARIELNKSPFPRYRHTSSAVISENYHVFIMGGLREGSVYGDLWALNSNTFETNSIENFDGIPAPRVGHNSCLCGNAFIIFGGDTIQTNELGELDNDLYLFNINSLKWTIPRPSGVRPCGRYGHTIGVIARASSHSKLYLFGGQLDSKVFSDLWVFDLTSFKQPNSHWEEVRPKNGPSDMPPPLTNHTMVVFNYKLYVFGGSSLNRLSNDVFCFDPATTSWSRKQCTGDIPPPVEEHASTLIKHLMIVYGGKNHANETLDDLYILNLNSLHWTRLEKFSQHPGSRCGHSISALFNYNRKAIAAQDPTDPAKFNNTALVPTKVSQNALASHALSVTKNKILIMGGDQLDYCTPNVTSFERQAKDEGYGTMVYLFDLDTYNDWSIKFKNIDLWDDKPRAPITASVPMPQQPQHSPFNNSASTLSGPGSVPSNNAPKFPSPSSNPPVPQKDLQEPLQASPARSVESPVNRVRNSDFLDTYVNSSADLLDKALQQDRKANTVEEPAQPESPTTPVKAPMKPAPIPARSPKREGSPHVPDQSLSPDTADLYVSAINELPENHFRKIDSELGPRQMSEADRLQFTKLVNSLEEELASIKTEMNVQAKNASDKIQELESQIFAMESENLKHKEDALSKQSSLVEVHTLKLQELESKTAEKDDIIRDLQEKVAAAEEQERLLREHSAQLVEKDSLIRSLEDEASMRDESFQNVHMAVTAKDEMLDKLKLEKEQQDELVMKLQQQVKEFESHISDSSENNQAQMENLHEQIDQKDNMIAELRASLANATAITPIIGGPTADEVEALRVQLVEKEKIIQELAENGVMGSSSPLSRDLDSDVPVSSKDLNTLRRENIELNSELIRVKANNETLNQKFGEFEPIMNNSIIELDKLNNIIQHQQQEISELEQKAHKSDQYQEELRNLQVQYDVLQKELENHKTSRVNKRSSTNEKISNISTDINRLVSLWRSKKDITSDLDRSLLTDDSLSEATTAADEDFGNRSILSNISTTSNTRAFSQLNSQINELIHINKEQEQTIMDLQSKYDSLVTESESLKEHAGKSSELEKLEENYRNAMNSVKKTGKALDMSQKELNKQKELNASLKTELEELRFEANGKANGEKSDNKDEDDLKNAHYDFKIKDLEAELFIIKEERDELKDSVLQLKKKLINSGNK